MTYYNLSNMSADFDFIEKTIEINSMADGMIGMLLLITIFLIVFISLKNYETKRAFTSASFITVIISILMNFINLISIYFTVVLIIMTVGGLIMIKSEDG